MVVVGGEALGVGACDSDDSEALVFRWIREDGKWRV